MRCSSRVRRHRARDRRGAWRGAQARRRTGCSIVYAAVYTNFALVSDRDGRDGRRARHARLLRVVRRAGREPRDAAVLHGHLALGRARGLDPLLGVGALAVRGGRRVDESRAGRAASCRRSATALLCVSLFFAILLIGPANPFQPVSPVPPDGPGPNPLLQNHILMAVHPPLLYLGYVGMRVPFAFAVGAMLSGEVGSTTGSAITRRWTLLSWGFLTAAIIAGMWWSYEVLGWGGYWAWDPVENASFMPWLTATAFLHSAIMQERRGMLRLWNVNLVVGTFVLTILGTFLTRSGIVSSVHAFTTGTIGYFFLAFIAIVLVAALGARGGQLGPARQRRAPRFRRVARNGVPAEQPVPHRIHVHGAGGHAVPARRRSDPRREGERRASRSSTGCRCPSIVDAGVPDGRRAGAAVGARVGGARLRGEAGAAVGGRGARALRRERSSRACETCTRSLAFSVRRAIRSSANVREYWIGMRARRDGARRGMGRRRSSGWSAATGAGSADTSRTSALIARRIGIAASSSFRTEREATLKPGRVIDRRGSDLRLKTSLGPRGAAALGGRRDLEVMNGRTRRRRSSSRA